MNCEVSLEVVEKRHKALLKRFVSSLRESKSPTAKKLPHSFKFCYCTIENRPTFDDATIASGKADEELKQWRELSVKERVERRSEDLAVMLRMAAGRFTLSYRLDFVPPEVIEVMERMEQETQNRIEETKERKKQNGGKSSVGNVLKCLRAPKKLYKA